MQRKCHKHQCQRRRTSSDSLQGIFDRKSFVSSPNHISITAPIFKLLLSILLCCQVHLGGEESEAVRLIQSSSEQPSSLSSASVLRVTLLVLSPLLCLLWSYCASYWARLASCSSDLVGAENWRGKTPTWLGSGRETISYSIVL